MGQKLEYDEVDEEFALFWVGEHPLTVLEDLDNVRVVQLGQRVNLQLCIHVVLITEEELEGEELLGLDVPP